MNRLLLALCLAAACGGTADNADELAGESAADMKVSPTEPITWVAMSQKAAVPYARNAVLMNVQGHITAGDAFVWDFIFADWSAGNWVTVRCDGQHTRVVEHHHNAAEPMGTTAIHLAQVKVTFARLTAIAGKAGLKGRITSASLSEALTMDMHPHWFLDQGGKEIAVDADTGKLFN